MHSYKLKLCIDSVDELNLSILIHQIIIFLILQNYLFVTEQMRGQLRVHDKKLQTNYVNYQLGYIPDDIIMYDDSVQRGNSCKW